MMNYNQDDVFTGVLPFYHIYGQTIVLFAGLKHGCKIVTLPKFESERFLQNLQDHRVSHSWHVNNKSIISHKT